MKTAMKKLQSARGETLTEVLCAVVVCTIAVLLLATCATMAANIGKSTQDTDESYYAALHYAETRGVVTPAASPAVTPTSTEGTVYVQKTGGGLSFSTAEPVTYYGADGLWSFAGPTPTPTAAVPGGGP